MLWPEQSVAYSINSDGFLVFGKWRPDVGHNHGKQFNWTGFEVPFPEIDRRNKYKFPTFARMRTQIRKEVKC